MTQVTTFRLYLLRATYLLLVVGQSVVTWPHIIHHTSAWALRWGDTGALLAGLSTLAVLGIRYPIKMLPLLLFELTWKTIWMLAIALPLWQADQIDEQTRASIFAVGMGLVIMPIVIPWPHVFAQYIKQPGERWR